MKPIRFDIITIFPEIFRSYFHEGMIRKGLEQKIIDIHVHNLRDYSTDKWKKVDDIPFGGGAGMVMTPQPLYDAIRALQKINAGPVIYLSPKGEILTHTRAKRLSEELQKLTCPKRKTPGAILVCGRYEGIDQRVIDLCVDRELSIGKYVLTGGELAAMVVIDTVSRFLPGLLGDEQSHQEDSFSRKLHGKKEYPHYTKPRVFKNLAVPEVLLTGHHGKIKQWRQEHTGQ
jgi:tRNA (guanine37-N1)-methyltransferase